MFFRIQSDLFHFIFLSFIFSLVFTSPARFFICLYSFRTFIKVVYVLFLFLFRNTHSHSTRKEEAGVDQSPDISTKSSLVFLSFFSNINVSEVEPFTNKTNTHSCYSSVSFPVSIPVFLLLPMYLFVRSTR